eukprot:TRINITY_DN25054_c0_g1_i2.p1 TRINITY_DN25054_c0_g1~~TRINITY_DN25054_c0_g1_i2.p1  ORF type:complete len:292 (+),score=53.91 TRINITY_DN25054_c0_g1_i2:70-945(+)
MTVAVSATRRSFQMPLEWSVETAVELARLAQNSPTVSACVRGFSTPSTADVGCASIRLSIRQEELVEHGGVALEAFGQQGSVALAIRRKAADAWLPAVAGVPGHHTDRQGVPRHGLLEVVIMGRPEQKGGVTFLHEAALRAWVREGDAVEVAPIRRLGDFHIDDGSGPWLRDRICHTASQAEDVVAAAANVAPGRAIEELLAGSGFAADRGAPLEVAPADEWDLARTGQLHRDCAGCSAADAACEPSARENASVTSSEKSAEAGRGSHPPKAADMPACCFCIYGLRKAILM